MSSEESDLGNFLTVQDIEHIDSTDLSALERHHVRLLAHCLETFKQIENGASTGSIPNKKRQMTWLLQQKKLSQDKQFLSVLLEQLEVARVQLEKIASSLNTLPLELTIDDLIQFNSSHRHD